MSDLAWYRSLYWRIALGFVVLLGLMLVLQGAVFLWMTGRMPELFPSRSPAQFAATIAGDLSATLAARRKRNRHGWWSFSSATGRPYPRTSSRRIATSGCGMESGDGA